MASANRAIPVILTGLIAVGAFSTDLYLPALPSMTRELGGDTSDGQLTLSLFIAGMAAGQLFYGPFSDHFGRKKALYIGMAIFVVASLACAFVSTIEQLWGARLIQGLGASAGPVLGRAIVADLYTGKRAAKMLSTLASAMALLPLIAPTVGGIIVEWLPWSTLFWMMAFFGVLIVAGATIALPESKPVRNSDFAKHIESPFRSTDFWMLSSIGNASFCILFAFVSGNSFLLIDHFGLSPTWQGIGFGIVVAGYAFGSQLSARLNERYEISNLMVIGGWVAVGGGLAVLTASLLAQPVMAYAPGAVAMFVGAGLTFANAQAELVKRFVHTRGSASAGFGFLQLGMGAVYGGLTGIALEWSLIFGLTISMSVAGLMLLLATLGWKTREQAKLAP